MSWLRAIWRAVTWWRKRDDEVEVIDPLVDHVDISGDVWHGPNPSSYAVTHALSGRIGGHRIALDTDAVYVWPIRNEIVGTCWFGRILSDGKRHWYYWDHIRRGQRTRDFPIGERDDWPYTGGSVGEKVWVIIATPSRADSVTVNERTVAAEMEVE